MPHNNVRYKKVFFPWLQTTCNVFEYANSSVCYPHGLNTNHDFILVLQMNENCLILHKILDLYKQKLYEGFASVTILVTKYKKWLNRYPTLNGQLFVVQPFVTPPTPPPHDTT